MFRLKYRYLFILLLAVYSYLNIFYTIGTSLFDFAISRLNLFFVLSIVVLLIWELNRLSEIAIEKWQLSSRFHIHPLIALFACSLANVAVASFTAIQLLYLIMEMGAQVNANHLRLLLAFGFRINLFLACVNAIVFFMEKLKKTQLEAEQLKQLTTEAQFAALRAQINPHFLFNSFNVLSSLVYRDPDASFKFISQLSKVYRYLLDSHDSKVVSLRDELVFLQSYIYLLTMRFGDTIVIENRISNEAGIMVPPAVLQMLIENAIKHNVVSRKNPLTITLFIEGQYINVSNSMLEKDVKEESGGVGLRNIADRYRLLTDHAVKITKTEKEFLVQLPILTLSDS
ncbi:MAG TPA: histidine kinase [Chryseosolibacter sp.]